MNIQQAKDEIKRSISVYLKKDAYGNYRIPIQRQRPIFLVGAPGIGKTAIMEQIAQELEVGLVSYSMTHHTRQSALGLPMIEKRTYGNEEFDVSVYTLSEILASVYELMEKTGKKEGILFLDEINCVSETLGPSMLQFLQYKTFGNHALPEGWVVVTAGNPAEFNRAVHAFDVATLDRLKVLPVEEDFHIWKVYAQNNHVHNAILTYLEIHQQDFFHIETSVSGKSFVTARGWEDLSSAITLYEEEKFDVDAILIRSIIQNDRIAQDFTTYYELYCKYRSDYQIPSILKGEVEEEIKERASKANFDERISVVHLLLEALLPSINHYMEVEDGIKMILPNLRTLKDKEDILPSLMQYKQDMQTRMKKEEVASGLSDCNRAIYSYCIQFYTTVIRRLETDMDGKVPFVVVQEYYMQELQNMKLEANKISKELDNVFMFVENHFETNHEILLLVTQLTVNTSAARFISTYGCDAYYRHNKSLMIHERNARIMESLKKFADQTNAKGTFEL